MDRRRKMNESHEFQVMKKQRHDARRMRIEEIKEIIKMLSLKGLIDDVIFETLQYNYDIEDIIPAFAEIGRPRM